MKPLRAAHRFEVDVTSVSSPTAALFGPAICAKFFANLSRSVLSSFSLLLSAPGLLFKLFRLITLTWSAAFAPAPEPPFPCPSSAGKASTRSSNVVSNFLSGLLRRLPGAVGLAILEMSRSCLILRLSAFVVVNNGLASRVAIVEPANCCGFFSIDLRGSSVVGPWRVPWRVTVLPTGALGWTLELAKSCCECPRHNADSPYCLPMGDVLCNWVESNFDDRSSNLKSD